MRFRLLSYLAAMLLLAGVLGANLTPVVRPGQSRLGLTWENPVDKYGWPAKCVAVYDVNNYYWKEWRPSSPYTWHWSALALDILIGFAIPIIGLLACEFALRRYAPRRKVE